MKPMCRVEGCASRARGYRGIGLCSMHYQRVWAHDQLFGSTPMRAPHHEGNLRPDGYRIATIDGVRKYDHIRVAEKALGRSLPKVARVHHVNEDKSDNRGENLVICPSAKYHTLLHTRMEAVKAGYPPHFRKCGICKEYDDPANMYVKPSGVHQRHRACQNESRKAA